MVKTSHLRRMARAAAWAPAAVWAYLLAGHGRSWSTVTPFPSLPSPGPTTWPSVAVIIPARDEAAILPKTLPSVLAQGYPGRARVVLVDDQSSDGTATLARQLAAARGGRGLGLAIVDGKPAPAGWAGKPWAMAQGVELAMAAPAPPEWLLFTDADIFHPPSGLRDLVGAALADRRACVSLMARLSTGSGWERLLMPAFVYFFAQIYPLRWVNDPHRRTAAAAGGCMLVDADALKAVGGIDAIAAATIDDVALAKALKGGGYDIWLGLAGDGTHTSDGTGPPALESRRPYRGLADIWEMVARNAYTQLRHSPVVLAGTVAALSSIYLAPPLLAVGGWVARKPSLAAAGLGAWTAMTVTYVPMARYYRVPVASAVVLPFTAALYMAMTLSSARRYRARGGVPWKGRTGPAAPGDGHRHAKLV